MIENAVVRHKSNHYVSGELFAQTIYARRGDRLGYRKAIKNLKDVDLKNIIEKETREAVIAQIEHYESGVGTGNPLSFAKAITHPIFHRALDGQGKGTLIKSVLIAKPKLLPDSEGMVTVRNPKNSNKPFIYKSGNNAYIEIEPNGNARLVSQFEAMQSKSPESYESKTIRRIFPNDLVREMGGNGTLVGPLYKVAQMSVGPILKLILATETYNFDDAFKIKINGLNKSVSGKSLQKWVVVDP